MSSTISDGSSSKNRLFQFLIAPSLVGCEEDSPPHSAQRTQQAFSFVRHISTSCAPQNGQSLKNSVFFFIIFLPFADCPRICAADMRLVGIIAVVRSESGRRDLNPPNETDSFLVSAKTAK